jgi:fermentation-respiration switch protein FrsA (DUF1100 family)
LHCAPLQARQRLSVLESFPAMMRLGKKSKTLLRTFAGLACVLMLFRWFEHKQVYHPSRLMSQDAAAMEHLRPWEDVYLKTQDGTQLNAWFFPSPAHSPRAQFVILLCHGNGGNISHRTDIYQALRELGVAVFAFDYRGYGLSQGRPGEAGTYLDAQAAYAWLRQKGFAPANIIAYGESLGGGVASELCVREVTGGLILQSTFTSIPDIGAEIYPWLPVRWLASIRYDTLSRLPKLKIPVLVMHSREDGMIGYRHSERNFAAANEPKLFVEIRGDHNDPLYDSQGFANGMEKFLKLLEARDQKKTGPVEL